MTMTSTARRPVLGREEKASLLRTLGFVLALHLLGWGLLLGVVAPRHYAVGDGVLGLGLGLTAYTLGMRHAFDADHIAAIDGTTRKLMADGQRPVSVGFWFSLGHSSVVLAMVMGIAFGVRALATGVQDTDSALLRTADVWGPSVSGVFLLAIGALNLTALVGIVRVFRGMRRGHYDEAALDRSLDARGLLSRLLARVNRAVRKPWHMYPIGFLFGLGFDTVSEIGLLVIAGGAAVASLPWWAVVTLPVLFAAGMSLLDTLDGAFMNVAYGWAFSRPVRKVYYNLTVTALSVVVALAIGVATLGTMLGEQLGGPLRVFLDLDLEYVGYGIVLLFLLAWAGSVAFWKVARVEERWGAATAATPGAAAGPGATGLQPWRN
ncbi:HoxN/HupN/NixA family nickel/cobalt transporter [Nocardioides jiangxiensis]|uniref:Nickel/cobalt efflux system n=1 Tax=Nocardioides jiangxiensis TaxID=3064524 RepID=A0ABT9B0S8_9ACTN|nr:HoxN/HupN/NixA family nickel/cobalt transporter [Nocardioides sp. WY-20]MDO7868467.1 HoxN/HupN/NixA family nickel/cobalt transporter [Nocardioides sp. WY-20]